MGSEGERCRWPEFLVLRFNHEHLISICGNDNSMTVMPLEELGEDNPMRNILSLFILFAQECKYFLVP